MKVKHSWQTHRSFDNSVTDMVHNQFNIAPHGKTFMGWIQVQNLTHIPLIWTPTTYLCIYMIPLSLIWFGKRVCGWSTLAWRQQGLQYSCNHNKEWARAMRTWLNECDVCIWPMILCFVKRSWIHPKVGCSWKVWFHKAECCGLEWLILLFRKSKKVF